MSNIQNADWFVAIDKSASMNTRDTPSGASRFKEAEESTMGICHKLHEMDKDGIDVAFFAGDINTYHNVTPERVATLYKENEPMGSTNTHLVLQQAFNEHFERKAKGALKPDGTRIVVVTDGDATDRDAVANVIIEATKKIDKDEELAIGFFQVGKDPECTSFLQFLDDKLTERGAKFDIVDTKSFEQIEKIGLKAALEAIVTD